MLKMRALLVVPSTDNAHNEKRHKFFYDGGGGGEQHISRWEYNELSGRRFPCKVSVLYDAYI